MTESKGGSGTTAEEWLARLRTELGEEGLFLRSRDEGPAPHGLTLWIDFTSRELLDAIRITGNESGGSGLFDDMPSDERGLKFILIHAHEEADSHGIRDTGFGSLTFPNGWADVRAVPG